MLIAALPPARVLLSSLTQAPVAMSLDAWGTERQLTAWQGGLGAREMLRLEQMKLPDEPLPQELQGLQLLAIMTFVVLIKTTGSFSPADVLTSMLLGVFAAPWAAVALKAILPSGSFGIYGLGWWVRMAMEHASSRTYACCFTAFCAVASFSEEIGMTQLLRRHSAHVWQTLRLLWRRSRIPDGATAVRRRWGRMMLRQALVNEVNVHVARYRAQISLAATMREMESRQPPFTTSSSDKHKGRQTNEKGDSEPR